MTNSNSKWIEGVPKLSGAGSEYQHLDCLVYDKKFGQKVMRIYNDGYCQIIGCSYDFPLKDYQITHYIPLDNINPPKDE